MTKVSTITSLSGWQRTTISIFVAALLVRVVFILSLKGGYYFADSVLYSKAAVNLLSYGAFGEDYLRPPLYPVFLAGIYYFFGEKIIFVRIIQAFMGACLAVMLAILGRRIGGERVGTLAGLLWSIYPLGVFMSGLVYSEILVTMLLAFAVLCMLPQSGRELGPGRIFLGGMLFGLAALTKPVVLVTIGLLSLWILYVMRARRIVLLSLFLLGVVIPLAPWTVRNFYVHGGIVIVEPRLVGHLPSVGDNAEKDKDDEEGKIEAILTHPGEFVSHFVRQFGYFWELYPQHVKMSHAGFRQKMHQRDPRIVKSTIVGTKWTSLVSVLSVGPAFFFALIGIGTLLGEPERRRDLSLLLIVIFSFAVGYAFFYGKTRYRLPVEPYILIMSAYGLKRAYAVLLHPAREGAVHSPQETDAAKVSRVS